MVQHQRVVGRRQMLLAGVLLSAMLLSAFWQRQAADAQVTEVTGSAYGFFTSVGLFGGPPGDVGPVPLVTLPPEGSAEPITETDADGESATYGPAVIVQTESMTVSTEGTTGPEGSVTGSSLVEFNENQDEQVDPFNADDLLSTCTADASGTSGSVTLNDASLVLNTDVETQEPVETIDIPVNPEPNTTFGGTIDHVGDTYRVVFNEQITEGDTLTVNAVHLYLGQNEAGEEVAGVAQGEAIIGQSVCGVNASGAGGGGETTTTVQSGDDGGSGATTTTSARGGSTATTAPSSRPAPTTPAQPRFTG